MSCLFRRTSPVGLERHVCFSVFGNISTSIGAPHALNPPPPRFRLQPTFHTTLIRTSLIVVVPSAWVQPWKRNQNGNGAVQVASKPDRPQRILDCNNRTQQVCCVLQQWIRMKEIYYVSKNGTYMALNPGWMSSSSKHQTLSLSVSIQSQKPKTQRKPNF